MSEPFAPVRVEIGPSHPAFDGHFPGQPVLPGVALLAEVLEAASATPALAAAIGAAPRLGVVKFLVPVRPGASLAIAFRLAPRMLEWQVEERTDDAQRIVASGQFVRADLTAPLS